MYYISHSFIDKTQKIVNCAQNSGAQKSMNVKFTNKILVWHKCLHVVFILRLKSAIISKIILSIFFIPFLTTKVAKFGLIMFNLYFYKNVLDFIFRDGLHQVLTMMKIIIIRKISAASQKMPISYLFQKF